MCIVGFGVPVDGGQETEGKHKEHRVVRRQGRVAQAAGPQQEKQAADAGEQCHVEQDYCRALRTGDQTAEAVEGTRAKQERVLQQGLKLALTLTPVVTAP